MIQPSDPDPEASMLASLFLALTLTPAGYTPSTPPPTPLVRDYLALCASDGKACADILFDHAHDHSVGAQRVGYCLPQSGEDEAAVTAKVVAWLKGQPGMGDRATDPSLNTALEHVYPCR
jgi:hypothetical protein